MSVNPLLWWRQVVGRAAFRGSSPRGGAGFGPAPLYGSRLPSRIGSLSARGLPPSCLRAVSGACVRPEVTCSPAGSYQELGSVAPGVRRLHAPPYEPVKLSTKEKGGAGGGGRKTTVRVYYPKPVFIIWDSLKGFAIDNWEVTLFSHPSSFSMINSVNSLHP